MALMGKFFKFDSNIYYYGIRFLLNGGKWSKLKVTLIYSTYPVAAILFGLVMLYIFEKTKKTTAQINLFFVWCFVIGTSCFVSQGVISSLGADEFNSPFYQNFSVVYSWWFLPVPFVYGMNIFFGVLLVYFGINYATQFLPFAYSYTKVNKASRRRRFFIEIAVVPFILGSLAMSALTFPMNIFLHAVYLMILGLGLLISWVALFYLEIMKDDVLKYKSLQSFNFFFLFVLALFVAFIKMSWRGIYFSL